MLLLGPHGDFLRLLANPSAWQPVNPFLLVGVTPGERPLRYAVWLPTEPGPLIPVAICEGLHTVALFLSLDVLTIVDVTVSELENAFAMSFS